MRHENHLRIFRGPPDPQLWVHQFNYCKSSNEFRMVWDGSSCSFHQCKLRALHAIFAPEAVWGDRQGMVRPWWGWAGWFTADNLEPQKNIKKWLWTCLEVDFWEKKWAPKIGLQEENWVPKIMNRLVGSQCKQWLCIISFHPLFFSLGE